MKIITHFGGREILRKILASGFCLFLRKILGGGFSPWAAVFAQTVFFGGQFCVFFWDKLPKIPDLCDNTESAKKLFANKKWRTIMEFIINLIAPLQTALTEALAEITLPHPGVYAGAGGLVLLIIWFYLSRISGNVKKLSRNEGRHAEEMDRHFANLEPLFKSAVSNIIELEIGRLKSIIESKLKSLRGAADSGENGGTNSADSQEAPAYYEEFAKTMAARADEHRLAMEERMENIAELIKRPPAPSSPAEQTDAPAMREQLEKLLPYLRDEFSAIAAKLENISKPGETKGALAIASDSKNAPADTPDSENAPADASDSEDAPADAPTAENADAMREQLEKLSLYLHDEFAAVAAKLENISKPGETIAPDTAADTAAHENAAREQLEKLSSSMHEKFAAVAAKLENMPAPAADHSMLLEMLNQSMNRLSGEVDAKLTLLNGKLEKHMETRWSDALASINTLREQIENLSNAGEQIKSINQNMTSLSRLMLVRSGVDEQGARQQLSELLTQILSAEHFMLDVDLPNGHCAAAMVRFPDPKDSVSIDAGLSLASFIESLDETLPASERDSKRQTFRQELVSHINHVADNLISPPHTGESALLFISSEAAFAEIHVRHRAAVKLALSRRVWLVSPTTLLAVVNTANTAIRDHEARIQLQQMQESVAQIVEEARHFENRLTEIGDHVNSAWRSVQRAENASGRLIGSIRGISGKEKTGVSHFPPVADDS